MDPNATDLCADVATDDFKLLNTDDSPTRRDNYSQGSQSDDDDDSDEEEDGLGPLRGVKTEKARWTDSEDANLRLAVVQHDFKNWKLIASHLPGKTEVQCLHRWTKVLNPDLTKGPWTEDEDKLVLSLVTKHGARK